MNINKMIKTQALSLLGLAITAFSTSSLCASDLATHVMNGERVYQNQFVFLKAQGIGERTQESKVVLGGKSLPIAAWNEKEGLIVAYIPKDAPNAFTLAIANGSFNESVDLVLSKNTAPGPGTKYIYSRNNGIDGKNGVLEYQAGVPVLLDHGPLNMFSKTYKGNLNGKDILCLIGKERERRVSYLIAPSAADKGELLDIRTDGFTNALCPHINPKDAEIIEVVDEDLEVVGTPYVLKYTNLADASKNFTYRFSNTDGTPLKFAQLTAPIAKDNQGNLYVAFYTYAKTDLYFIVKLTPEGKEIWKTNIPDLTLDRPGVDARKTYAQIDPPHEEGGRSFSTLYKRNLEAPKLEILNALIVKIAGGRIHSGVRANSYARVNAETGKVEKAFIPDGALLEGTMDFFDKASMSQHGLLGDYTVYGIYPANYRSPGAKGWFAQVEKDKKYRLIYLNDEGKVAQTWPNKSDAALEREIAPETARLSADGKVMYAHLSGNGYSYGALMGWDIQSGRRLWTSSQYRLDLNQERPVVSVVGSDNRYQFDPIKGVKINQLPANPGLRATAYVTPDRPLFDLQDKTPAEKSATDKNKLTSFTNNKYGDFELAGSNYSVIGTYPTDRIGNEYRTDVYSTPDYGPNTDKIRNMPGYLSLEKYPSYPSSLK